jgi:hypothetical protein
MKKHLIFIFSLIAMNTYTMEPETHTQYKPCWFMCMPHDVLDLIANYLPFDDIETEQEFI